MTSLAATEKPSGRFFSAAAMASRPPSSRAMPDRLTLVSDSVILPSFSLPTWSSSNSAALSKRGGAPRDRFIRSTTSTPPRLARAASIKRPLLAGSGELPDSVTRRTSRSADQTNGLASGTSLVSSLTSRTPGTASTDATALCRPSSEKASAASVTSRPATEIRRFVEDGVLEGGGRTLRQVGFKRFGAGPGRDSPKDDQRNDARPPFATPPEKSVHSSSRRGPERRENKPLRGCQTRNVAGAETALKLVRLTVSSAVFR